MRAQEQQLGEGLHLFNPKLLLISESWALKQTVVDKELLGILPKFVSLGKSQRNPNKLSDIALPTR